MNNKYNIEFSILSFQLKRAIILLFLLCSISLVKGQSGTRFAVVDLEYVLNNIPDYIKAQQELNDYSLKLQGMVDVLYEEIGEMQSKYNADKVFLTATMREQREKAIAEKENKARLLQQQYFGVKGDLFLKREELVKPIQDEVLAVMKDVAKEGNYGMIIDISADNSVNYYDPKLDKSKTILRKLGYSPKESEPSE